MALLLELSQNMLNIDTVDKK